MTQTIRWLLDSNPYVEYRTRLDLLDQSDDDPAVMKARANMLAHPLVLRLIADLGEWPGDAINNHKKAGLLMHKLAFAAELGLTIDDPGMENVLRKVSEHISEQGIPRLLLNFPKVFGGTGEAMWGWTLCDTPRLLFSLTKMGAASTALEKGLDSLSALVMENGWPCAASPELGSFRGPGKKSDPCPYATLLMLESLLLGKQKEIQKLKIGAECLLNLWDRSRESHPFLFYMGTDFRKLKAPFVWYDILHVADILSQMEWLRGDARYKDMVDTIGAKANEDGTFTPESVWMAWKTWDFSQKKAPSPWITFLALRIFRRSGFH